MTIAPPSGNALLEAIHPLGVSKKLPIGDICFHAGTPAHGFYVVVSGEIRLYKMDENGKEAEITRLHAGQFLGEVILFASAVFPVTAVATQDTELLFFEKSRILQAVEDNPVIAHGLLGLLARKCLSLNRTIEQLALSTVRQRLIAYLLQQSEAAPNEAIQLSSTKTDLAKTLSTIPETLSRTLKQLQDERLITVDRRQISLVDRKKLQAELT